MPEQGESPIWMPPQALLPMEDTWVIGIWPQSSRRHSAKVFPGHDAAGRAQSASASPWRAFRPPAPICDLST
jgi:hypothetical protein